MLKWFEENFPDYVEEMKICEYSHPEGDANKHHLEGDVWSHTLLAYEYGVSRGAPRAILWALLLHDIGRVHTRMEDDEERRVFFSDFEGVSCFVALEMLKRARVQQKEQLIILKLIAFQYTIIDYIKYDSPDKNELLKLFEYEEEILYYLALYVECDLFGRKVDESVSHLYDIEKIKEFQKFAKDKKNKIKKVQRKKNRLYLLVGPPCSRKSTWMQRQSGKFLVVNRDSSMEHIGKKYNKHTFNEAYDLIESSESIKKEVSAHYRHIESFVKKSKNIDIIIDNPNLKLKHRKEWIDIFHTTHTIKAILFLSSFEALVQCDRARYMSSGKSIGDGAILDKLVDFIYPLPSEGIDEIDIIFNK